MPSLYKGISKPHAPRKKSQLTPEERKENREVNAEKREDFDKAFADWYGDWLDDAKALSEAHGIPLPKILAMFGAKLGEGKTERSATAYNAWQSTEIKRLNEGRHNSAYTQMMASLI